MCGIIVSNKIIQNLDDIDKKLKKRGPDNRNIFEKNGVIFIHYLLHITGDFKIQPFINENIVCLFNGEIYNYKELLGTSYLNNMSDGECLIPLYKKYGNDFIKFLDGEYSIVLFDFSNNTLIISSDIFRTKPLYYHISSENIIISSYLSVCKSINSNLNYTLISPNQTIIFNLNDFSNTSYTIYNWNLDQYKNNLNDWEIAFENAVLKRYSLKPIVSMSSGLDSGSIVSCLLKYNKDFLALTINQNEDCEIIRQRINILGEKGYIVPYNTFLKQSNISYLREFCEDFRHTWKKSEELNILDIGAYPGKIEIFKNANNIYAKNNLPIPRILLNGNGGDEIMGISPIYDKVNSGNPFYFPDNLSEIFPWNNFYNGSMYNYVMSDEFVSGSFSYESRYPFLDKDLVQEFLWLKPEIKNLQYKYPLIWYLNKHNFPYCTKKMGFNV
jgi:asparagine synthetase B (glutamine-hydrolysing)